jgi:ribosomal protein S17
MHLYMQYTVMKKGLSNAQPTMVVLIEECQRLNKDSEWRLGEMQKKN